MIELGTEQVQVGVRSGGIVVLLPLPHWSVSVAVTAF